MKKAPKLVPINLKKGKEHEHPDIKEGSKTEYLARVFGGWYVGSFYREWFGLTFSCNFGVSGSIQFDAPGSNGSEWKELYEIKRK